MQSPNVTQRIKRVSAVIQGVNQEIEELMKDSDLSEERCEKLITTLWSNINYLTVEIGLLKSYISTNKSILLSYAKSLNDIKINKLLWKNNTGYSTQYFWHKDCHNLYSDVYNILKGV